MKRLELNITALAPLAIGRQKPGGSVSEVEQYIPGAVLRGAIAGKILQQAKQQNPELPSDLSQQTSDFQALFLGDAAACFQNAYPAIATLSKNESRSVTEPVYVLPATAVAAKNDGGFKQPAPLDQPLIVQTSKGVFDTLIDRFCAEQCGHLYDPSSLGDCSRVEPFGGFYSKGTDAYRQVQYRQHSVSTRFLTRVGINRRRATAEDELLYGIEVLNESFLPDATNRFDRWEYVRYRGYIWVPTEPDTDTPLAQKLADFINRFSEQFRIGGSTSRGLGKVKIEAGIASEPPSVKDRVTQFTNKLHNRWQQWKNLFLQETDAADSPDSVIIPERTFFTIDLQSDAILSDRWQHTTLISPTVLLHDIAQWYEGEVPEGLQLHAAYSSYDYRSGWNSAWGLMKDMALVTNKGAVYLFSFKSDQLKQWLPILEKLEQHGIGDRTAEGFGQVHICNEFHIIFREEAV